MENLIAKKVYIVFVLVIISIFVLPSFINTVLGTVEEPTETETKIEKYTDNFEYMWNYGPCEGEWPDNEQIVKIVLYRNWVPEDFGAGSNIYAVLDFKEKKSYYGYDCFTKYDTEPNQIYDLSDEDIESYKNNLNRTFNYRENSKKGWWRIAVEYEDGTIYSYELGEEAYNHHNPEYEMIHVFFNKIVIPEKYYSEGVAEFKKDENEN